MAAIKYGIFAAFSFFARAATVGEAQMANIQPNRYVLQRENGFDKVDYETSSFIGHGHKLCCVE